MEFVVLVEHLCLWMIKLAKADLQKYEHSVKFVLT